MTPIEVLRKARALLRAKKRWTKGASARDKDGAACGLNDPRAASWCMIGATGHVDRIGSGYEADRFLRLAIGSVQAFNDTPSRTHAQVMNAFRKAIEIARRREL